MEVRSESAIAVCAIFAILTAAGGLAHDEIAPVRRAAAAQVDGLLSARDRKDLYRILDRLDAALNELDQEEPEVVWEEP